MGTDGRQREGPHARVFSGMSRFSRIPQSLDFFSCDKRTRLHGLIFEYLLMSPLPVDNDGGSNHSGGLFGAFAHVNIVLQLITLCHLLQHLISLRLGHSRRGGASASSFSLASILSFPSRSSQASISLLLGLCTLGALVAYILGIRPLQGDIHFLTLRSRTPHRRAQPVSAEEDYYQLHQRFYDLALVCIFASAVVQLSAGKIIPSKIDRDNVGLGKKNEGGRLTNIPEWFVVIIGLAGAIALAAMRSPLLEAFLGDDFDKTRGLSGASALIAFLLILWRFVAFLDICSTVLSLGEKEPKDAVSTFPLCAAHALNLLSFRLFSPYGSERVCPWRQSSASMSYPSCSTNVRPSDHLVATKTREMPQFIFSTLQLLSHSPR
ncbi:hypothetical protein M408DRAFT_185400 [Serendipita vermifera MAFF 305830]|uniref:Uncharacterized protein n=1 Tax=Serendipita vermifera MAFF 305830 TaxID=933852 RepID=A0A0C2XUY6_SERVB|nr:hypothetical protein M408DRAFT_185400 [Serendipita vermifera MAFF 305830]